MLDDEALTLEGTTAGIEAVAELKLGDGAGGDEAKLIASFQSFEAREARMNSLNSASCTDKSVSIQII